MPANDIQVGGDHYKTDKLPQHWDLAILYEWDFFQYQITKYIMRWKKKHSTPEKRLEDLKKARHFLDKYIENAEKFEAKQESSLARYEAAQSKYLHGDKYLCEGGWGDGKNLYTCKICKHTIVAPSLDEAGALHDPICQEGP